MLSYVAVGTHFGYGVLNDKMALKEGLFSAVFLLAHLHNTPVSHGLAKLATDYIITGFTTLMTLYLAACE